MAVSEFRSAAPAFQGEVTVTREDGDVTVVRLLGEHDVSTAIAVSETLARAIALDDVQMILDLSGVEFMDASTVRLLTGVRDYLEARSRRLTVRSASPCTRRIFALCGLSAFLEATPARPDAALVARNPNGVATPRVEASHTSRRTSRLMAVTHEIA